MSRPSESEKLIRDRQAAREVERENVRGVRAIAKLESKNRELRSLLRGALASLDELEDASRLADFLTETAGEPIKIKRRTRRVRRPETTAVLIKCYHLFIF